MGMISMASLQSLTGRSTALFSGEALLIGASVWLAITLPGGASSAASVAAAAMIVTATCQACNYYRDLYDYRLLGDPVDVWRRILQSLGLTAGLLALARASSILAFVPTEGLVLALFALGLVMPVWRVGFEWFSRNVWPSERLLVVGVSGSAMAFARELTASGHRGVDVVGFVDVGGESSAAHMRSAPDVPLLGGIEDIPAIVRAKRIDKVVVSLADARGQLPMQKLLELKLDGVAFQDLASIYEQYMRRIAVENLRPSWLIFSDGFRKTRLLLAIKRATDIVGAGIGLILSLPIMLVVAAAVKLSSPGPVFYRQRRVGQHGRVFTLRKFRSMRQDAEVATGAVWAAGRNDPRVTRVGRYLRRTHLDELPQLWNILVGDMSLIGPRPERPEFVTDLSRVIPFYGQRHLVRPGLTGWAQVWQAYGASVDETMEKLQYDLFYIKNMSVLLDLYVAVCTVKIVLQGRGV